MIKFLAHEITLTDFNQVFNMVINVMKEIFDLLADIKIGNMNILQIQCTMIILLALINIVLEPPDKKEARPSDRRTRKQNN